MHWGRVAVFLKRGCEPWSGLAVAAVLGLAAAQTSVPSQAAQQASKPIPEVGIRMLDESVGDAAWSLDGRTLAYSKRDTLDFYMKLWTAGADGSGRQCLTCDPPAPAKHCGDAAWHPSGEFLVFSAENEDVRSRKADLLAEPGVGLNTNLWVMTADGTRVWRLTRDETSDDNPRGAVHPQFSPDGARLVWAGPVNRTDERPGYEWGEWALFLGDFETTGGTPTLTNVRAFQPGDYHGYYESHDWSPDGRAILCGGQLVPDQPVTGLDIFEYEIATGETRRLTQSRFDWDSHAKYGADGRSIYWLSSRTLDVRFRSVLGLDWMRDLASEVWVMKRDGRDPRRVTWFNQSGRRDAEWFRQSVSPAKRVYGTDLALSADRSTAALTLAYESQTGQTRSALVLLDLDRRRPDWH